MTRNICTLFIVMIVAFGCAPAEQVNITVETEQDKISYSLGADYGNQLKRDGLELDPAIIAKGVEDALADGDMMVSAEEQRMLITDYRRKVRDKQMSERRVEADGNKKKSEAFLAENKAKDGIITLESGLQYKIITEGDGPVPQADDRVKTHYRGTLMDGTEFDSSYTRNNPATFSVTGVIKGWTEALQLMKVGSKWQLFIPPELAYGERGAGSKIGPNSALIFEIELLEIVTENNK